MSGNGTEINVIRVSSDYLRSPSQRSGPSRCFPHLSSPRFPVSPKRSSVTGSRPLSMRYPSSNTSMLANPASQLHGLLLVPDVLLDLHSDFNPQAHLPESGAEPPQYLSFMFVRPIHHPQLGTFRSRLAAAYKYNSAQIYHTGDCHDAKT
jgi:hypothetical protein